MSVLRGKFDMAIIKDFEQLKPMIATGKALQTLAGAAPSKATGTGDDFFTKLERIIPSLDHLLDTALKVKQGNQAPAGNTRQVLTEPHTVTGAGAVSAKLEKNAKAENEKMVEVKAKMVEFFSNHLSECVKENPNMTIGEAIMKLPINVTQLAALLQVYKLTKGG